MNPPDAILQLSVEDALEERLIISTSAILR